MIPQMRCNTCFQRGDGYWAGKHTKAYPDHEYFAMEAEDEPPSKAETNQGVSPSNRLIDRDIGLVCSLFTRSRQVEARTLLAALVCYPQ